MQQLFVMGITGNMIKFINEFLSYRYIKVKVVTKISSSFRQEQEVPQGNILSDSCFVILPLTILLKWYLSQLRVPSLLMILPFLYWI